jgi:hypothetical protein|tara:strand:+ start:1099 stop:1524 length:426 start_codon:yes stop_codon:yes gene_type:complete
MEIDEVTLLIYASIWTVFYFFLSNYIAELSRRKWTTWVQSEESDEILLEALEAVIQDIEDRMHDKLQAFQDSFFGSVGAMTKKAKDLDPMNGIRKAAKDGDWTSMMVEYAANKAGLGGLLAQQQQKPPQKQPQKSSGFGKL